jgi:H+-translocating NAD(P) transhydrogenase subunit alpha
VTTLAVIREQRAGERRVALVPAEIAKVTRAGVAVAIEAGAGLGAGFADEDYLALDGVRVLGTRQETLAGAGLLVTVSPPTVDEVDQLPEGATLVCLLPPAWNVDVIARLRDRGVSAFSFDLMPRTSRAQAMDALSSQASLAGYQAVLVAAARLGRAFPVMMTAAGTVPPARLLVMGAGVAGLQAVATSRRLGAAVTAYDVRPEAAEEVRSLGATFLDLPIAAQAGEGGYAAEQTADFLARQQELVAETVARSDVVITTAAVPGRHAPRLVSTSMIEGMRRGSVIVDLAAAAGGNTEVTVDGQEVDHGGVCVIGASDLPSEVATTASNLYARNVTNFLALLLHDGEVRPDFDDDIVAATCVTAGGMIRHAPTRDLLEATAS